MVGPIAYSGHEWTMPQASYPQEEFMGPGARHSISEELVRPTYSMRLSAFLASAWPCSAAFLYNLMASSRFSGTPTPW